MPQTTQDKRGVWEFSGGKWRAEGTLPDAPAAVTDLAASTGESGGILLEWTATAGAVTATLWRRDLAVVEDYVVAASVPAGIPFYQDTGLLLDHLYIYYVILSNDGGDSPVSNNASARSGA